MRPNKNFNDVVEIKETYSIPSTINTKYCLLWKIMKTLATMWEEENIPCTLIPESLSKLFD